MGRPLRYTRSCSSRRGPGQNVFQAGEAGGRWSQRNPLTGCDLAVAVLVLSQGGRKLIRESGLYVLSEAFVADPEVPYPVEDEPLELEPPRARAKPHVAETLQELQARAALKATAVANVSQAFRDNVLPHTLSPCPYVVGQVSFVTAAAIRAGLQAGRQGLSAGGGGDSRDIKPAEGEASSEPRCAG